jgi:hypothetical protein
MNGFVTIIGIVALIQRKLHGPLATDYMQLCDKIVQNGLEIQHRKKSESVPKMEINASFETVPSRPINKLSLHIHFVCQLLFHPARS